MRQILFAAGIALAVSILLTPVLIKMFSRQGFGQEIRVEHYRAVAAAIRFAETMRRRARRR